MFENVHSITGYLQSLHPSPVSPSTSLPSFIEKRKSKKQAHESACFDFDSFLKYSLV